MTETTTPSVEGDRLEAIAKLVDPWAFESVEEISAGMLEGCAAMFERGEKPSNSFLEGIAEQARIQIGYRADHRAEALSRARQIAALPCKGGEARIIGLDPAALELALLDKATDYDNQAMDHPGTSRARPYCQAKATALREAVSISRNLPATPTTEADTGRGLREATDDDLSGWLAALSDTPRGRLEK